MERQKSTRERIWETAVGLFAEKGFGETSMRDIAEKVGIRASSLYNHFASKEEILDFILDFYRETMNRRHVSEDELERVASAASALDMLRGICRRVLSTLDDPRICGIARLLAAETYRSGKVRDFAERRVFNGTRDTVRRVFHLLSERGKLPGGDPEASASIYFAVVNANVLEILVHGLDRKIAEEKMMRQFRAILGEPVDEKNGEAGLFKGISRAVCPVADMKAAKEWYGKVLAKQPIVDLSGAVIFLAGDDSLMLTPGKTGVGKSGGSIVYWEVENVGDALARLVSLGAHLHTPEAEVFGTKRASVTDPFGNVVGLTAAAAPKNRNTVGEEASGTAQATASFRALSVVDERLEIPGSDTLARIFLAEERRRPLTDAAMRGWLFGNAFPPGIYEFLVARTAWLDALVEDALLAKVPQLVFLGAGYDTRAFRFARISASTRIFEVDAPPTQERKRAILAEEDVKIPENLTWVPIHFENESLSERLPAAGYQPALRTLFVWEGVIYYLTPGAIDGTLAFIREFSGPGSRVAFDYRSGPEERGSRRSKNPVIRTIRDRMPSEPIRSRLEKAEAETFLRERGFRLTHAMDSAEMEERFYRLKGKSSAGSIAPFMHFAEAEKV
jgi:methyltransferase (TIGR00027 family)